MWSNVVGLAALALALATAGFNVKDFDGNAVVEATLQLVTAGSFVASSVFRVLATKRIGL